MKHGIHGLTIALCMAASITAHAQTPPFTLSSPDLSSGRFDNQFVLNGFGCKGQNVSPALQWTNVPAGTKSLALQVYDPDAPTGSGFWHWAVYNIPADATGLARGAGNSAATLPAGAFGGQTVGADCIQNDGASTGARPCCGWHEHRTGDACGALTRIGGLVNHVPGLGGWRVGAQVHVGDAVGQQVTVGAGQRGSSTVEGMADSTVFFMMGSRLRAIGLHRVSNANSLANSAASDGPWANNSNPLLPPLDESSVPKTIRDELRQAADAEALHQHALEASPAPPLPAQQ